MQARPSCLCMREVLHVGGLSAGHSREGLWARIKGAGRANRQPGQRVAAGAHQLPAVQMLN